MIRSKYFKIYKYFKKNRGFASKLQLLLLLSDLTAFSGNTITAVLSVCYTKLIERNFFLARFLVFSFHSVYEHVSIVELHLIW